MPSNPADAVFASGLATLPSDLNIVGRQSSDSVGSGILVPNPDTIMGLLCISITRSPRGSGVLFSRFERDRLTHIHRCTCAPKVCADGHRPISRCTQPMRHTSAALSTNGAALCEEKRVDVGDFSTTYERTSCFSIFRFPESLARGSGEHTGPPSRRRFGTIRKVSSDLAVERALSPPAGGEG